MGPLCASDHAQVNSGHDVSLPSASCEVGLQGYLLALVVPVVIIYLRIEAMHVSISCC